MVIFVNGEKVILDEKVAISEFLNNSRYTISRVVVEKNGEIIPRTAYETEYLDDRDEIEIVHFVGGG